MYDDGTIRTQEIRNGWSHSFNDEPSYIEDTFVIYRKNGLRHRETGPAIIFKSGEERYFLDDIEYTQLEFYIELDRRKTHR